MLKKLMALCVVLVMAFSMAACAKLPTPFEEPEKLSFPTLPPVSIKGDAEVPTEADSREEKTFRVESPDGKTYSMLRLSYHDGIVDEIYGEIHFQDKTIENLESLKNDIEICKEIADEYDLHNVTINVDEDDQSYTQRFHFQKLDTDSMTAELAAAFVGIQAENGKIMIESATEDILGVGYVEQ